MAKTFPPNREKVRIRAGSFEHDGWLLGTEGPNPWEGKRFKHPEGEKSFTLQPSEVSAEKVVIRSDIGLDYEVNLDRVDAILAESIPVKTCTGWAL